MQFDVFGEHREQAAHEEQRHFFRRMALASSRFDTAASRSAISRVALCRLWLGSSACGSFHILVKSSRVSGFAQFVEMDAKALAIGELGVVAAFAGEIGIELEAMADIAHHDEGRPFMR